MPSNSIKEEGGWLYLLLALCVAIILWYTINAREQIERQIEVRLDYKGLPQGLVIRDGQINKLQVRLRAPRELFRNMDGRESYTVDLTGVTKGVNILPFEWSKRSELRMYQVLEVIPPHLSITVDALTTREVPVVVRLREPGMFEDITISWLTPIPAKVTLKGPEAVLDRLNELVVQATPSALTEGPEHTLDLPVVGPMGVEATPAVIQARYTVALERKTLELVRPLRADDAEATCRPRPGRVRLRVAVPVAKADDTDYLEDIRASLNTTDSTPGTHPEVELPIQVQLPEGARLESIAPAMGRLICE